MTQFFKYFPIIIFTFWISFALAMEEEPLTLWGMPPEIKAMIFEHLPTDQDLLNARSVCHDFNAIILDDHTICADVCGKSQLLAKKNVTRFKALTSSIQSEPADSIENLRAHFLLGEMYLKGLCKHPNYQKAYGYFLKSDTQDRILLAPRSRIVWMHKKQLIDRPCSYDQTFFPESEIWFNIALSYECHQDYEEAAEFYQQAADQGCLGALNRLAVLYLNGRGVSRNEGKAVALYQKAADQNDEDAQRSLGALYIIGRGVPQDFTKAAEYLQKAVDQWNIEACVLLGSLYNEGRGVPQDKQRALKLYQDAAGFGSAEAQYILGHMYNKGEDVPQDKKKALEFYQKAADQEHPEAQDILGAMYALGQENKPNR